MKKGLNLLLIICTALCMIFASAGACFAVTFVSAPTAPGSVYVDANGNTYASDTNDNNIVMLPKGQSTWVLFSGKTLSDDIYGEAAGGILNGAAEYALYSKPSGIAPFLDGFAITDSKNNVIRYIAGGAVQTISGSGEAALSDGSGAGTAFNSPTGIVSDGQGNIYIADTGNNAVRMMNSEGVVSTIIQKLNGPTGLAFGDGTLFIADTGNHRIIKYVPDEKKVYLVAGDSSYYYDMGEKEEPVIAGGYKNGNPVLARFDSPKGLAYDAERDILFIGDCGNNAIRMLAGGRISTLFEANPTLQDAYPAEPVSMYYAKGTLYVADSTEGIYTYDLSRLNISATSDQIFTDIYKTAWYKDAVTYAYSHGLFSGTTATTFEPQKAMTRAMFVTVLGRLHHETFGGDIIGGDSKFSDVPAGKYFSGATAWAADSGIVKGIGAGTFAPNDNVTRQQMAVMLYSYIGMIGGNTEITDEARAKLSAMPDAGSVAGWALDAVAWAFGNGILSGKDGRIAPAANATRAEVAQILYNYSKSTIAVI